MSCDRIRIPAPCTADWGAMKGDETRRFCDLCNKHVHNLSAMSELQARTLLEQPSVCVRARLDAQGRVMRDAPKPRSLGARALLFSASLIAAVPAFAAPSIPEAEAPAADVSWSEWLRAQIGTIVGAEPETPISQGEIVMGDFEVEPTPKPPPEPEPFVMGRIAMPFPVEPPLVQPPPVQPPPVQPPPVQPIPLPAPGESVIPEVEEAIRRQ